MPQPNNVAQAQQNQQAALAQGQSMDAASLANTLGGLKSLAPSPFSNMVAATPWKGAGGGGTMGGGTTTGAPAPGAPSAPIPTLHEYMGSGRDAGRKALA